MTPRRLAEIDSQLAAGIPAASFLSEFLESLVAEPEFLRRLAHLFLLTGNWPRAVATAQLVAGLRPDDANLKLELGTILSTGGAFHAALECYEHALRLEPKNLGALFSRAQGHHLLCQIDEALADYEEVLRQKPGTVQAQSARLVALNYRDHEQTRILEEARAYGAALGGAVRTLTSAPRAEPFKIGFLSPDFRTHSNAYFLTPLLERAPKNVQLHLFHDSVHEDEVTTRFAELAQQSGGSLQPVAGMDNSALESLLLSRGLDILVDLAGHFSRDRLAIFARRVAPVQVSYLGYPNTTGVPAMDWRIGDDYIDAGGLDEWTERLTTLRAGMLAYAPPEDAPPIEEKLPATPTFGYFGHLGKISPDCAKTWGQLAAEMPHARWIIKGDGLGDPATRDGWQKRWANWGFDTSDKTRFDLREKTKGRPEHLAAYNEVTVSLDTWPYNGTTTICESLWMGVPVITLEGKRHASRVASALLRRLGNNAENCVAHSLNQYITLAEQLAEPGMRLQRRNLSHVAWLQHDTVAAEFWSTLTGLSS